jgi:mannose/cellobiose epimerase-like protein (N-acyl-D-glucosamine 2-epimerase family)
MLDPSGRFVDLDDDGRPRGEPSSATGRPQSLLTVARAVHSYALGELLGVPGCGQVVERGLDVLWREHRDARGGGYVATTDASGWADTTKAAYGHAFVLLAASSARAAGHDAAALYDDVLAVIDERFWSESAGATQEDFDREWNELEPYRGANSNMHLCEAFLAAGDATGDGELAARAVRIAELLIDGHARSADWMLPEHYDPAWRPERGYNRDRLDDAFRPYGVTVGHLLEWSRLCLSAWLATGRGHDWLPDAA